MRDFRPGNIDHDFGNRPNIQKYFQMAESRANEENIQKTEVVYSVVDNILLIATRNV